MPTPNDAMVRNARRALEWREEFNRGGTQVGVSRARDIVNRRDLSRDTLERMVSYFARHEVDKDATGFSQGEDGFPSAGRIAWDLWGGDAGKSWANAELNKMENSEKGLLDGIAELLQKYLGSPLANDTVEDTPEEEHTLPVKKAVEEELMQATFVALLAYPDDNHFDLHGDTYDAEEVRKACHSFNKNCMKTNIGHVMMIDDDVASIVESYTSDVDMQVGDQFIPKGSWLQKWQFADGELWEGVKKGYWNGISIGAMATVEYLEDDNGES